jgi:hypothetical protein
MRTYEKGRGNREPGQDEDVNAPAQVIAFTCSCGAAYERTGTRSEGPGLLTCRICGGALACWSGPSAISIRSLSP